MIKRLGLAALVLGLAASTSNQESKSYFAGNMPRIWDLELNGLNICDEYGFYREKEDDCIIYLAGNNKLNNLYS